MPATKEQIRQIIADNSLNSVADVYTLPKTLKSRYGEFQIDIPRDREGKSEPKLIPKYQRDISGIEEKVISLYARA